MKCILEARDESLWVGTLEGLFRYHSGKWTQFTVKNGLADNVVRCLCEDNDRLWIGAGGDVHIYKDGVITETTHAGGISHRQPCMQSFATSKGGIWMAVTGGLAGLNNGQLSLFTKKDGLPDDNVTVLSEDRQGNLWIGTSGGLCRMSPGQN